MELGEEMEHRIGDIISGVHINMLDSVLNRHVEVDDDLILTETIWGSLRKLRDTQTIFWQALCANNEIRYVFNN